MKTLSIQDMEMIQGGGTVDAFCAGAALGAVLSGGTNVVADVIAVGCVGWWLYNAW